MSASSTDGGTSAPRSQTPYRPGRSLRLASFMRPGRFFIHQRVSFHSFLLCEPSGTPSLEPTVQFSLHIIRPYAKHLTIVSGECLSGFQQGVHLHHPLMLRVISRRAGKTIGHPPPTLPTLEEADRFQVLKHPPDLIAVHACSVLPGELLDHGAPRGPSVNGTFAYGAHHAFEMLLP